ncbi:MAG: flagellar biosynthesis protein FlhF [Planctomycetota bacterium]|nr:flagellar biosynthesis protein FlhF [Planctomycetota bacterium]
MSDALARVKADLGRDAVILNTRTVKRGGVLGVGGRAMVEITATLHAETVQSVRKTERPSADKSSGMPVPAQTGDGKRNSPALQNRLAAYAASARGPAQPDRFAASSPAARAVDTVTAPAGASPESAGLEQGTDPGLRRELESIRTMVNELLRDNRRSRNSDIPSELVDYYVELIGKDVTGHLAAEIIDRVRARLDDAKPASPIKLTTSTGEAARDRHIRQEILFCLGEMIPPASPLKLRLDARPTVVALVGPTGVGKTTTLAKLAANMKLRESKRVGLITVDTFRIAAVEQLKTYARILDVPLLSVTTPDEIKSAVTRLADRDLILIDTAGRSQKDTDRLTELKQFLQAAATDQIHLVLSTTSREQTIREAIDRFGAVGSDHLIFTKIDEAYGFGVILNVLESVDLKLSYLTNGQSVPDDIEVGTAHRVARLILEPDGSPERSGHGSLRIARPASPASFRSEIHASVGGGATR